LIINLVIQQFVHLDRPESVLEWVWKLILKHLPDASFPSDHTAIGIAFLVSLFFAKYYKIWIIFTIPVILMCISRVVLGVHFPFDILGWAIVWIIWAIISFKFLKKTRLINSLNDFILKIEKKIFAFFIEKK
jgi:undecaprenyl-diphosphatase